MKAQLGLLLNFSQNEFDTVPVGSHEDGASPYGVNGMAGNVWEWVADWYDADFYGTSPDTNPSGPASGNYMVLRCGSWFRSSNSVRTANRYGGGPTFSGYNLCFRCARGISPTSPTIAPTGTELPTEAPTTEPTEALTATSAPPTLTPQPALGLGSTLVSDMDAATLVYIPAGEFRMGSNFDNPFALDNERPQHVINMPAYWMDQTEVTNEQYAACVAAASCTEPRFFHSALRIDYYGNPDYAGHPVVWVNWQQATVFCAWAERRLPTESEWEKAARGEDGRIYPWGNEDATETYANFDSLNRDTQPVGSYPEGVSPYGVLDMAGNVAEWVDAYYTTTYYSHYANLTATPEAFLRFHEGLRVLRNGAWNESGVNLRTAFRRFVPIGIYSISNVGFRCAMSVEA